MGQAPTYLKSLKKESVVQSVINQLTDAIRNGDLKPGDKIPPVRNYSNREGDRERTLVLKELCLARAIFNLGDTPDGLGRRTLEAYAADPRRAYAEHARLVLAAPRGTSGK